jgi:hypothetical protein
MPLPQYPRLFGIVGSHRKILNPHTTGHFKFWGCANLPGLRDLEGLMSDQSENVQKYALNQFF